MRSPFADAANSRLPAPLFDAWPARQRPTLRHSPPLPLPMQLLIVTANDAFATALRGDLQPHGCCLRACGTRSALHAQLARQPVDLLLLDVPPRHASGFASEFASAYAGLLAAAQAVQRSRRTPFIMLGQNASSAERIAGLDSGAADYLSTPFPARELVARMRGVLRRCGGAGLAPTRLDPAAVPVQSGRVAAGSEPATAATLR